jgi:hypothetical protein
VQLEDLRVRLSGHDVARRRIEVGEHGERVDPPFDPFAAAEQPPGEDDRCRIAPIRGRCEVEAGAVRDRPDLLRVDHVLLEQPRPGGPALHDEQVGKPAELLDDAALAARRLPEHGVKDDDRRQVRLADEVDDLGAVGPAVDPELVLDDRDVELAERRHRRRPRFRGAAHQLGHDLLRAAPRRPAVRARHDSEPALRRRRG